MTTSDVTAILARLAVIETKIDAGADDGKRVRRLELVVTAQAVALIALFGKAAGLSLPGLT